MWKEHEANVNIDFYFSCFHMDKAIYSVYCSVLSSLHYSELFLYEFRENTTFFFF